MRLREMFELIQRNRPLLQSVKMDQVPGDNAQWKIEPLQGLATALAALRGLPLFLPRIEELQSEFPMLFEGANVAFLANKARSALQTKLAEIDQLAIAAMGVLKHYLVKAEEPLEVAVCLPSDIRSPPDLQEDLSTFISLLDQIPRRLGLGGVTFQRVDVGSNWLVFLAENASVLTLVVSLTGIVVDIVARRKSDKKTLQAFEGMEIHLQAQAALAAKCKEIQDELVTQVLLKSSLAINDGEKNEAISHLSATLDQLCSMYERGATIMLSSAAPAEIRAAAPAEMSTTRELRKIAVAALSQGKSEADPK